MTPPACENLVVGSEDAVGRIKEGLSRLGGSSLAIEHAVSNVLELGVDLGDAGGDADQQTGLQQPQ